MPRKKRISKNVPDLYGKDYWHQEMGYAGGATRWENNGAFYNHAIMLHTVMKKFGGKDILDVGCGRGWVLHHLKNLHYNVWGCEYGREILDFAVVPRVVWGDLAGKLPYEDGFCDLANCAGVLTQLPEHLVAHALKELHRVSRHLLFTNIQTGHKELQKHHLCIQPREFWYPLFEAAGWKQADDALILRKFGFERGQPPWAALWEKI